VVTKLGGYVAFILFVHAALHDANAEQRVRLRTEVRPLLDVMRDKEAGEEGMMMVMEKIMDIMGKNWKMNDESRQWIESMLGDKK
jgi:hypothetical protein